jgi:hypothetical protein
MTLSGRQAKRSVPVTRTGLWVLRQAASWLAGDGPDNPNALREKHLPLFAHARQQVQKPMLNEGRCSKLPQAVSTDFQDARPVPNLPAFFT